MQRVKYLDTLRGLAILLVVFSHIYSGNRYMIYISIFNVPLFFIISGYLLKKTKRNIQRRILKRL